MNKKTMRACQVCGMSFYGSGDYFYCPSCAKNKKSDTVVKIRICQDCHIEFFGGPRAKRCPDCAYIAKINYKRKPTMRPIGSIDKCIVCGNEYTVVSGRQKYCSETCQRKGVSEWQREHKRNYHKKSGQDIKKAQRRERDKKICVYCLRKFASNTSTNVCSDYCRKEQQKLNQCITDINRGRNRNLEKYEKKREKYREECRSE